ncbi:MAG: citrate/2-methylcitrate synthase [Vicinamibacterales bacterium]
MESHLLPAAAAATRLGIKRTTLYAYVSRGLVTAYSLPGRRGSWFDPIQLDALTRRARDPVERRPDLRMTSAITLIEGGRYWYRGRAPEDLAATRTWEAVAEFLWTGDDTTDPPAWPVDEAAADRAHRALASIPADAPFLDRLRLVVAVLGAGDPLRLDLRPAGALATARRLTGTAIAAISPARRGRAAARIAAALGRRRPRPEIVHAVDRALIVMADHELAASTVAVRVAASFRADPYAAVLAGLGAMAGSWHGGASRQVETLFRDVAGGRPADAAVSELLARDAHVPGFGQPLYPAGDPRVTLLLPLARSFGPTPEADAIERLGKAQGLPPPNVDFALATLVRALGLTFGAGEALFALGRLAGWLAHAIEEYESRTAFRMRAVYAGPRPGARIEGLMI